jgi:hypothetical protein
MRLSRGCRASFSPAAKDRGFTRAGSSFCVHKFCLGGIVKQFALHPVLFLLAASAGLLAQTGSSLSGTSQFSYSAGAKSSNAIHSAKTKPVFAPPAPFSRLALGGGISAMGINMQAAVNTSFHVNLRAVGNYFNYSMSNVKISGGGGSSGVNVSGKLNFASLGAALDYYPFPKHGWRLSPGVMLFNQNEISASGVSSAGTSITLGGQTYYSDTVNPMAVSADLGLNTHRQAFTLTTGWGNMISRKGGHWSFPFELGAVFAGVPSIKMDLTGNACGTQADSATNGPSCVNMATNATAQANLSSQIAKYQNELNPLQVYPIFSFGVAYNFRIRGAEATRAALPPSPARP